MCVGCVLRWPGRGVRGVKRVRERVTVTSRPLAADQAAAAGGSVLPEALPGAR